MDDKGKVEPLRPVSKPSATEAILPWIDHDAGTLDGAIKVLGHWNLRGLANAPREFRAEFKDIAHNRIDRPWDLTGLSALDTAGAYWLWDAWGQRLPDRIKLRPEHESAFRRWQQRQLPPVNQAHRPAMPPRQRARRFLIQVGRHFLDLIVLLGQLVLDLLHLLRHPGATPWREISATLHETGARALGITALVGFLIGVVVSYLSSLQLQTLGAQIYIINILGLSIIRELGPLLAAILVAGRSGSAMTARIGVMRVTQELDAIAAMGISPSLRLILPKVVALVVALPLLVVWTDLIALVGGAVSAKLELGIGYHQFFSRLPAAVPVSNLLIGLLKGVVFGLSIALIACHFGLRIQPNTESLGDETTNSVVVAITLVILIDAVFAILFRGVGIE